MILNTYCTKRIVGQTISLINTKKVAATDFVTKRFVCSCVVGRQEVEEPNERLELFRSAGTSDPGSVSLY